MESKKQKLARGRNWTKFKLAGLQIPHGYLTKEEMVIADRIRGDLGLLIGMFDKGSLQLGLNVRVRCWCGKVIGRKRLDAAKLTCSNDHDG